MDQKAEDFYLTSAYLSQSGHDQHGQRKDRYDAPSGVQDWIQA